MISPFTMTKLRRKYVHIHMCFYQAFTFSDASRANTSPVILKLIYGCNSFSIASN